MEVDGACEALARSQYNPVGWLTNVKGVVWEPIEHRKVISGVGSVEHISTGRKGAFVRLDMTPNVQFLSALGSLGLTNPLDVAWEVLPFSFVVDWFIPIGNWLNVLDAMHGYRFRAGSWTLREELEGQGHFRPGLGGTDEQWIANGPFFADTPSRHRKFQLQRGVYDGWPLPRFPQPRLNLNLSKVADGISLLATAFKRGNLRI